MLTCWLTALLLSPAQLTAEPLEIALVTVVAGPALDARGVERAVEAAVERRRDLRLVLAADVGSLAGTRLRDCGPDAACLSEVLRETTVPLALMVVVNTRVQPPVVAVRAVGALRGRPVRAEELGVPPGATTAQAVEQGSARVLEQLGFLRWAHVVIRAEPETASASVLEPALARDEAGPGLWLPPGPARLRIDAPGHSAEELRLEVAAAEDRTVDITLEPENPWWRSPWFWSAVGLGVAAGVTGTVLTLTSGDRCACVGHPSAPCACP